MPRNARDAQLVRARTKPEAERVGKHMIRPVSRPMKVISLITDFQAVDRIIDHPKLQFVAAKPPPLRVFEQVTIEAIEENAGRGSLSSLGRRAKAFPLNRLFGASLRGC